MGAIDNIVYVTITRATAAPSEVSYNGILIASEFLKASITPAFNERVREYTSLADIVTEGFATSSPTYLAAKALFAQSPNPGKIYVGRKLTGVDGTETWTAALTAMALETSDWYGLTVGTKTLADLQEVATWTEANKKLFFVSDDDPNIIGGVGDIAEYCDTNNLIRTAVFYHPDADLSATDPFFEMCVAAKGFTYPPGSINWALYLNNLAGVSAYPLTSAERSTAIGKNCNIYESIAGIDIVYKGTVGSGEYIDIIHGTDWLETRIQSRVFGALTLNPKIPYTDAGIQCIVSEVQGALQEAVNAGLIIEAADPDRGYSVSAPRAADVSLSDRAARTLSDVTFIAFYQGAISKVEISGTISV